MENRVRSAPKLPPPPPAPTQSPLHRTRPATNVAVFASGEIVAHWPMPHPPDKDEYNVVVAQRGQVARRWEWEIVRNGRPLPVPLRNSRFWSERTARAAGNVALREFLEALAREQNNSSARALPRAQTAYDNVAEVGRTRFPATGSRSVNASCWRTWSRQLKYSPRLNVVDLLRQFALSRIERLVKKKHR